MVKAVNNDSCVDVNGKRRYNTGIDDTWRKYI